MMKNKFKLKHWLIIGILAGIWAILTLFYIFNYNLSLSVISYTHSKDDFYNFTTERIFKGDKLSGEFKAEESYLGIVSVGFSTFGEVSYDQQDILVFRIKEKGKVDWYYENTYRSGLMYEVPFFPFGFPVIPDSQDKTYLFEIESLRGSALNAVAVNPWGTVLASRYQIPREKLLEDKEYLLSFFTKKILVSLGNQDVVFYSVIYILPLIFYLILLSRPKFFTKVENFFGRVYNKKSSLYHPATRRFIGYISRYLLVFVLIPFVLFDIFFTKSSNDAALIVVGALWLIALFAYNLTYRHSFIAGFVLLVISFLFLYSNQGTMAEISTVWAYVFIVAGTLHLILDLKIRKD